MRIVVNKFINQVESRVDKIKKKVDKDTVKRSINVGKQTVAKIPKKDQMIKRFASPFCDLKSQNKTEEAYMETKNIIDKMAISIGALKKSIDSIDRQVNNIIDFIEKVKNILSKIDQIVTILLKVIKVLGQALGNIPAQFVTAGVIIKLGDIVKTSEGMVATFKAMIDQVPGTLDYYEGRAHSINLSISPVRERTYKTDNYVLYHKQVLESVYLKYINVCNVPDQEYTDNEGIINEENLGGTGTNVGIEQQNAVDNFLSADPSPENTLNLQDELVSYYTETISSLQAKGKTEAIERIYRADFSQILLDRKQAYQKIDISTE